MKKMLLIALALGLVVAMAVPAMATDWSARGHIFVGGAIHKTVPSAGPPALPFVNVPLNPAHDSYGDTMAWVRSGVNLTITARQSEDLYGVLGFNWNSRRWGEQGLTGVQDHGSWYRPLDDDSGVGSFLVQEAFIDFRVPPKLPIWLRIGIQPYVIRPWLLVNTVGPGLTGRVMIDPIKLSINMGWAKKWEGFDYDTDDVDAYFADFAMPIGPVRVGAFVWYENFGNWWPTGVADDSGARSEADLYWFGVYADGKIGPIGLQFDFMYSGGDIDMNPLTTALADVDVEAWIVRGVFDISPIPRLTVGLGALYGTGEDATTNDSEEFMSVNNREGARQQGLPALNDFLLLTAGMPFDIVPARGPMVGFIGGPVDIGGVWYVRGFAHYAVTDWMRLCVNLGWIGDTQDDRNKFGTGQDPEGSGVLSDDDDIGFEMDFGVRFQLYKNLGWGVAFGYLFAGDALDQWDGTSNDSPSDPWAITTAILYTF
jgi:hypothetical protein